MKKYIFPHPVLAIEGRLFMYVFFAINIVLFTQLFVSDQTAAVLLNVIMFIPMTIIMMKFFEEPVFGIIKATDEYVLFFGLFLPYVKLRYSEIKYVQIRTFDEGNVMYGRYNAVDAYKFLLLSSSPLPTKRIDKIHSSKKGRLIKFAVSEKLCAALVDKLPDSQCGPLRYQLYLYKKTKQGKKRVKR